MFPSEIAKDRMICESLEKHVAETGRREYYLQLAADIFRLQEAKDEDQMDDLWSAYGYRDCLNAIGYAGLHRNELPDPRVVPGEPMENHIPVYSVSLDQMRPIEELLEKFPAKN